jgi:hypothetical protein
MTAREFNKFLFSHYNARCDDIGYLGSVMVTLEKNNIKYLLELTNHFCHLRKRLNYVPSEFRYNHKHLYIMSASMDSLDNPFDICCKFLFHYGII